MVDAKLSSPSSQTRQSLDTECLGLVFEWRVGGGSIRRDGHLLLFGGRNATNKLTLHQEKQNEQFHDIQKSLVCDEAKWRFSLFMRNLLINYKLLEWWRKHSMHSLLLRKQQRTIDWNDD